MNKEQRPGSNLPNKITLILRLMAGGYLIYTAVPLLNSFQKYSGGELVFFIVFGVLFAVAGVFLLLIGGYGLYKGKYAGGAMDIPEPETSQTAETSEEGEAGKDQG